MTDDLVKRLRLYAFVDDWINEQRKEAADALEAQAQEIERLREELEDKNNTIESLYADMERMDIR